MTRRTSPGRKLRRAWDEELKAEAARIGAALTWTPLEERILERAAATADRIAEMESSLADTLATPEQARAAAAVAAEIRLQEKALVELLSRVSTGVEGNAAAHPQKARAARRRWALARQGHDAQTAP